MKNRCRILAFLLSLGPLQGRAWADWKWHQTISPHFVVSHESAWAPPGFVMTLEKMHNRLRRDLAMFSPWISRDRLNLFLYSGQESYLGGQFAPPAWSNGIAILDQKAVVVFDQASRTKLHEIISHETTHLLFEGYWKEAGKTPPSWLNEGLSMMEETDSLGSPEKSEWYRAMAAWPISTVMPLKEFLAINPTQDIKDDKEKVSVWYIQAFSLVYYLYQKHSRLQFKNLCSQLRDGRGLEETLWMAYRYPKIADLEKAWRAWLASPEHRRRVEKFIAAPAEEKRDGEFKSIRSFENFR